jgi:hypothetical protein
VHAPPASVSLRCLCVPCGVLLPPLPVCPARGQHAAKMADNLSMLSGMLPAASPLVPVYRVLDVVRLFSRQALKSMRSARKTQGLGADCIPLETPFCVQVDGVVFRTLSRVLTLAVDEVCVCVRERGCAHARCWGSPFHGGAVGPLQNPCVDTVTLCGAPRARFRCVFVAVWPTVGLVLLHVCGVLLRWDFSGGDACTLRVFCVAQVCCARADIEAWVVLSVLCACPDASPQLWRGAHGHRSVPAHCGEGVCCFVHRAVCAVVLAVRWGRFSAPQLRVRRARAPA